VIEFRGATVVLPLATGVTLPMPWLIENDVAFVVTHERVAVSPAVIDVGEIESEHVGAVGFGFTVIVVPHVAVPPAPVTVAV
jgi:hypothetical protein